MIYKILSIQLILAALVAVFVMPVTVMAAGGAVVESAQAVSAEKSIEGTLTAMERYGHILIKPETGNLTRLRMRPDAVVTRNGKPAEFRDLRAGDKVRVNYDTNHWVSKLNATGS